MGQDSEGRKAGIPRRTLIKRGAIVGGLVWATPVVQSLRIPAHAQEAPGSELCAACISATIDPVGPPPPVTSFITFDPTTACCDCIAAGGGSLCRGIHTVGSQELARSSRVGDLRPCP